MNPLKTQIQARQKFFWKIGLGVLGLVLAIGLFSLNSNLLKGDIFQGGSTKTAPFYIPDYPAKAGDLGDIQIVSTNALNNLAGFSFVLVYNPNQISIPNNMVSATGFDFVNSNNIAAGRLKVIGASGNLNGLSLSAGANLVTIDELALASNLPNGTVLDLKVEDFEIVTSVAWNLTSNQSLTVASGKITIGSSGTLQLLSAEVIDNLTVKLNFSDYITNLGTFTINNGLNASSPSIDPTNGKAILVKTTTQTKGTLYEIIASGTTGNTAGALSANNKAYFTGIGALTLASDFNFNSVTARSATGLTLTFSHEILDGSVYPTAFVINETANPGQVLTISKAQKSTSSSNSVDLTLANNTTLVSGKNYKITVNNTGLTTDLRRKSDSALLGKNLATFPGYAVTTPNNVFSLTSATAIAGNQVKVVFSENLAANTVDVADFSLSGLNIASVQIPYEGQYNQVLLNLSSGFTAGQYYTLIANNTNGLSAYSGNILGANNAVVLVGYGTFNDTSGLALKSAIANSLTQVVLEFNQTPLASTITPVNFEIKPALNITEATVAGTKVTLTTALQTENTLYTVIAKADKLKDQNNAAISAANTAPFNGYSPKIPVINSILPNQITNEKEQTLIISGDNFETGTQVLINTLSLSASVQNNQISATVPTGTTAGIYDLILKRPNGEQVKKENALVIDNPIQTIKVISEESYSSPARVPNDGTTPTTLWVRISDPKGVSNIDKVYLDLRPINASPATEMIGGSIVDTKRWFSLQITVPNTVATSNTPLALEVTAQNKVGEKAFGTVSVTVSNNITSSVAPVVWEAYSTPSILKPGGGEEIYFYAYVKDEDGANTINSVVINLGPLGGAPMVMTPVDSSAGTTKTTSGSSGTGAKTTFLPFKNFFLPQANAEFSAPTSNGQWYKTTSAFKLPSNMRSDSYDLIVTATDNTWETGTLTLKAKTSVNQNRPFIDDDKIYITPRDSLPNDNKTTFVVYAYVEDPDGIQDINSVTIDLQEIHLPPATMTTTATSGLGGWYKTADLKVPVEVIQGMKRLDITAYDKSGASYESNIEIRVTNFDEVGEAPLVNTGKSYTSPNFALNDETTKMKIYAFISDQDEDIDYAMINLSNVAKYTGANTTGTGSSGYYDYTATEETANPCATNSETILCMTPSVKEGSGGQWFVLNDVVILKEAVPSIEPYRVWVTAVDKTGKSSKGFLNINVSDGKTPVETVSSPTLKLASATSLNSVEVVISAPIDASKLSKVGKEFKITDKSNTSVALGISKVAINTAGNIITLTTSDQVPGTKYAVIANADLLGLKNSKASDTNADFIGYQDSDIPPQIDTVTARSSYLVEVSFDNALKPTSVAADGSDFEIFTAEGTAQNLKVYKATLEDQYTVLVTTDAQVSNLKYRIRLKNVTSAAGRPVKSAGLTGLFKGYQNIIHESAELKNRADFNGDGKVDFTDFTMFSAVYGEMLSGFEVPAENATIVPYDPVDATTAVWE